MASSTRRGWLDKKPSSGRSGSWQRRWVVLQQTPGVGAKISWYSNQPKDATVAPKGSMELVHGMTVKADPREGFVIEGGAKAMPLRHSLAEHQTMWMKSITEAIEGKLEPSPEDNAQAAMQNMAINAETAASVKEDAAAKKVRCKKEYGRFGLRVLNSDRGAGVLVEDMPADSSLQMAGLNVGDTILTCNGKMVKDNKTLVDIIDNAPKEEWINLTMATHTHKIRVDKANGLVEGKLGMSMENSKSGHGFAVVGLSDDSAAAKAGLEVGDEIVAVNGKLYDTFAPALEVIAAAERYVDLIIKGADHTTQGVQRLVLDRPADTPAEGWHAAQFEAEPHAEFCSGVKVTSVTPDSAAAKAGLVPGVVVYAVNNMPVKDQAEVLDALLATVGQACYLTMPM